VTLCQNDLSFSRQIYLVDFCLHKKSDCNLDYKYDPTFTALSS
jgi:hypothetical protein